MATSCRTVTASVDFYQWPLLLCDALCQTDSVRQHHPGGSAVHDGLLYGFRTTSATNCTTDDKDRVTRHTTQFVVKRFDSAPHSSLSDTSSFETNLHARMKENETKPVFRELQFLGTYRFWRNPRFPKQVVEKNELPSQTMAICDSLYSMSEDLLIHLHVERYDSSSHKPVSTEQFQVIVASKENVLSDRWIIIPLTITNLGETGDHEYRKCSVSQQVPSAGAVDMSGIMALTKVATTELSDVYKSIHADLTAMVPVLSDRFKQLELEALTTNRSESARLVEGKGRNVAATSKTCSMLFSTQQCCAAAKVDDSVCGGLEFDQKALRSPMDRMMSAQKSYSVSLDNMSEDDQLQLALIRSVCDGNKETRGTLKQLSEDEDGLIWRPTCSNATHHDNVLNEDDATVQPSVSVVSNGPKELRRKRIHEDKEADGETCIEESDDILETLTDDELDTFLCNYCMEECENEEKLTEHLRHHLIHFAKMTGKKKKKE